MQSTMSRAMLNSGSAVREHYERKAGVYELSY